MKCLLIYPNPESALNEEAGKLLLEQYAEYSKQAKMMTEIYAHAPTSKTKSSDQCTSSSSGGRDDGGGSGASSSSGDTKLCKKRAAEKLDKKKQEKKRALKRL